MASETGIKPMGGYTLGEKFGYPPIFGRAKLGWVTEESAFTAAFTALFTAA
jgi:hypothetical protein